MQSAYIDVRQRDTLAKQLESARKKQQKNSKAKIDEHTFKTISQNVEAEPRLEGDSPNRTARMRHYD